MSEQTEGESVASVVLDASLLIAHLSPHDRHHRAATAFLAEHAGTQHWISTLNRAEVLTGYARKDRLAEGVHVLADLGVAEFGFGDGAAVDPGAELAAFRAETGLTLPDCCVLLAARQSRSAVASFDERLRAAAVEIGLTVLPVQTEPSR